MGLMVVSTTKTRTPSRRFSARTSLSTTPSLRLPSLFSSTLLGSLTAPTARRDSSSSWTLYLLSLTSTLSRPRSSSHGLATLNLSLRFTHLQFSTVTSPTDPGGAAVRSKDASSNIKETFVSSPPASSSVLGPIPGSTTLMENEQAERGSPGSVHDLYMQKWSIPRFILLV